MTNTSRRREVAPMRRTDGDRLLREGVDVGDAPPRATRKPDRRGSLSGSPPPPPRLIGDAEPSTDVHLPQQGTHDATATRDGNRSSIAQPNSTEKVRIVSPGRSE
jgi:hypothetical protein